MAARTKFTPVTVAEARAVLRELGIQVGDRGRLSAAHAEALRGAGYTLV